MQQRVGRSRVRLGQCAGLGQLECCVWRDVLGRFGYLLVRLMGSLVYRGIVAFTLSHLAILAIFLRVFVYTIGTTCCRAQETEYEK